MRFLLACLSLVLAARAAADDRPNVLFCIADDWGWPHSSAYGDAVCATPTFERLAAEGVLFEAAFVSSPSCTPSRNALLTGQHFFRLGEGANLWSTLAPEHRTFMELLAGAGYHTGHWRKAWGPGSWKASGRTTAPAGEPFDGLSAFLEARPEGAPFCFWLGAHDPHRGYELGSGEESGLDLAAIELPPPYPESDVIRGDIADYYYEVQRFDRDVGAALVLLAERGELDDTVVIMTGDHGFPFPRGKTNLYDLGSRVPLALRYGASVEAGQVVKDLVSLVDVAPTLLQLAGVPQPEAMTGRSWVPLVTGEGGSGGERGSVVLGRERHTVAQRDHGGGYPMRGLRTQDWLYIRNLRPDDWPAGWEAPGSRPFRDIDNGPTKTWLMEHREAHPEAFELCFGKRPAEELYHLASDPFQLKNLAGVEHAEVRARLAAELEAELRWLKDPRVTGDGEGFDLWPYRGGR
ncbi:MAG: sulfatase [Planctomycetota bacterium]|nr:sulfatase [Planctomycetota bacterium]